MLRNVGLMPYSRNLQTQKVSFGQIEEFLPKLDMCLDEIGEKNPKFTASVFKALYYAAQQTQIKAPTLSINELNSLLKEGPKTKKDSLKPEAVFLNNLSNSIDQHVEEARTNPACKKSIFVALSAVTEDTLKKSLKKDHYISDEEANRINNGGRIEYRRLSLSLVDLTRSLDKVFMKHLPY